MSNKQTLTFQTIFNWIESCKTQDQVLITKEAVIELYDNRYNRHNEPDSILLHDKCNTMLIGMNDEVDIYDVSEAD